MASHKERNHEFSLLTGEQQEGVRAAIRSVRENGRGYNEPLPDGGDVYAYEGAEKKVFWGVNGREYGQNIARGVVHEGESL